MNFMKRLNVLIIFDTNSPYIYISFHLFVYIHNSVVLIFIKVLLWHSILSYIFFGNFQINAKFDPTNVLPRQQETSVMPRTTVIGMGSVRGLRRNLCLDQPRRMLLIFNWYNNKIMSIISLFLSHWMTRKSLWFFIYGVPLNPLAFLWFESLNFK